MSEVKTYEVNCNDAWLNTAGDDSSGSYVKYADYMALATKLDLAERACAELAAENVGIKSAIPESRDIEDDNDNMDDVSLAEDFGFNHAIERMRRQIPETPTTDAFLDEVRAQGVDMARNAMIDFVDGEVGPNKNVPGLIRGAEICVSIAEQLRK